MPIAAQLYTLREFTKTPADIARTFKRVKEIGYNAVQCSALGPIEAKELKQILDDTGLVCCATHVGLDRLRDHTQAVIDDHALWGCAYTAVGGFFPKADDFSHATWSKFISDYNAIARKFAGSGVSIGYHNHSHELARVSAEPKAPTAWSMLLSGLSRDVWIEVDTYWIQHGGGDPAYWIDQVTGRIPCVHLKDLAMKSDRTQMMAEVGQGNLNWTAILAACRRAGVKWYIIEQDVCPRDPFDCLKVSFENVRAMGVDA